MSVVSIRSTYASVNDILSYENEKLIERHALDFNVSHETAQRRFHGLKQFLYLCAITPGYKVTSDSIDSMWHTFLLFTKEYRLFCETYLGRFINHEPFEQPSPDTYLKTRSIAERLFKPLDETLWPSEAKGDCTSGCDD